MTKFSPKAFVVLFVLLVCASSSHAVSLDGANSIRTTPSLTNSYDDPSFNAFAAFNAFTSTDTLAFSAFTGGFAGGAQLSFFMMSEVAYFDGNHVPGLGNKFGLIDSANNFQTVFDTGANPGDSHTMFQGESQSFTFGLLSPEGLFSSIDGNNPDGGAAHLVAKKVEKSGQVFIPKTTLMGGSLYFDLLAGDYILFWEDLLNKGNVFNHAGLPSDFDYNDLVIVVRQTAVPEPSSYLLLGLGALAMMMFRRSRNVTQ